MASRITLTLLVSAVLQFLSGAASADLAATPCPNGQCPGLGQGFVLSTININDAAQQTSGQRIFLDASVGTCATISPVANSSKTVNKFQNKRELINTWSAGVDTDKSKNGVGLSYAGFTLGVSASATFKSTFTDTKEIIATNLDQLTLNQVVDFNRSSSDCWSLSNLSPSFLAAFESLAEIDPATVSEDSAWQPYRDFLNNWGSHIQVKQEQGSRVTLWESSTSTDTLTTNDLEAKLCYDLGALAGSVGACNNYNTSQRIAASQNSTNKTIYILGGDSETRAALVNAYARTESVDQNSLDNFMNAGKFSVSPVKFGYIPIWSLLTQLYQPTCTASTKVQAACKNYQRALALQAAYQGFMAYSCYKAVDSTNNPFQKMIALPANSLGITSYACHESKSGCRRDKDCHYHDDGLFGWSVVTGGYCYGSGCITAQQIPGTSSPSLYRAAQKTSDNSNDPHLGTNASCSNDATPACNTDWEGGALERDIWNQAVDGPGSGNAITGGGTLASAIRSSHAGSLTGAGDDSSSRDQYTLKVIVKREKPLNLKATRRELALSKARTSVNQEEYLTVSDSTGALYCPGTCIASFSAGKQVNLRVNGAPHYRFLRWGGEQCSQKRETGHLCSVKMDSDKTIEAYFE